MAFLEILSLGATILGGIFDIAGQQAQAQSIQNYSVYQAAIARNNAAIAQQQALDAIERGKVAERQQRIKTAQTLSSSRASFASRGIVVDEGSALDIAQDIVGLGELDALTIRSNAEREALAFRQQGMNFEAEATLALARGEQAIQSARFGSIGTLLTIAGRVAQKWYGFKKTSTEPT